MWTGHTIVIIIEQYVHLMPTYTTRIHHSRHFPIECQNTKRSNKTNDARRKKKKKKEEWMEYGGTVVANGSLLSFIIISSIIIIIKHLMHWLGKTLCYAEDFVCVMFDFQCFLLVEKLVFLWETNRKTNQYAIEYAVSRSGPYLT